MRAVWLTAALLLAALAASCVPVPAWQRGLLAHRCMDPEARLEEARAEQHLLGARETTRGAAGEVGGGCGCR